MKLPLILLTVAACMPALAISPAADSAERQRIDAERAEVEKAYAAREAECRQRFIVTSCLDAARRDRREAMERLRQQQVVLDEAQRKQRAAERIDTIRSKVSAEEGKRREAEARVRAREAKQQEQAARAAAASQAASAIAAPAPSVTRQAHKQAPDAKRVSDYEKRQSDAKEHRAAVERRNAEHAAKGKPSMPLPAPSVPAAAEPP